MTVKGYCVVCGRPDKENGKGIPMNDPVIEKTSKGGFMAKGFCSKCAAKPEKKETKMCAMMSKDNAEKAITDGEAKKGY